MALFQVVLMVLALICLVSSITVVDCQEHEQQHQAGNIELPINFPYYLQQQQQQHQTAPLESEATSEIEPRAIRHPNRFRAGSSLRKLAIPLPEPVIDPIPVVPKNPDVCIYNKRYFAKLDECLSKKPYPTVGLPAFKNEDLMIKRGIIEKHGCLFMLNNGMFKNYQISRLLVDSDNDCLDGSKVSISMAISNITLSYLWTLRCLNRADQLLEDATLDGAALDFHGIGESNSKPDTQTDICVGSSQNFGFASLQLNNIEAQVDLYTDVYKNWRVTNITMGLIGPANLLSSARSAGGFPNQSGGEGDGETIFGTNIRDFVFESLDGDELNWRYLHLFKNWSRNRMHANLLDQYRRFLWIYLQRCIGEAAEKLPTKIQDVFANQHYN